MTRRIPAWALHLPRRTIKAPFSQFSGEFRHGEDTQSFLYLSVQLHNHREVRGLRGLKLVFSLKTHREGKRFTLKDCPTLFLGRFMTLSRSVVAYFRCRVTGTRRVEVHYFQIVEYIIILVQKSNSFSLVGVSQYSSAVHGLQVFLNWT